jgi:glycosyltransferase involved in cell wall biosynthesis
MDIMHGHSASFGAESLISLMDLQVFEPDMLLGVHWSAWYPVDHATIPPAVMDRIKRADYRMPMSKHAAKEMDKTGLDYFYVPCAIDTSVLHPMDRDQCREELKFPKDKFIVGMVAMNKGVPSRKAFKQNIAAFAALKAKYKDCVMYIHTMDGTRGFEMENLPEYLKALGLTWGYAFSGNTEGKDVIFANQYGMAVGYEPPMMAKMYNALDVLTACTMGEGFGIPIIEAQACGTPVIVGDWTSMSELCVSGWMVDKEDAEPMFTPLGAFQYLPRATAIAKRMEDAYKMRGNNDYRKRAEKGVQVYDIEKVMEKYWLPAIKNIAESVVNKGSKVLDKTLSVLR